MKLSIIIPYYNAKPYTDELLDCLAPQIEEDIEVILIDDGSKEPYQTDHKWCRVYRQKNKGVSSARNKGLDMAAGEYIAFIDSDDLVSKDYIHKVKDKIPFDYCDLSWRSLPGGQQFEKRLTNDSDRLNNPSAVTRVFSRAAIGNVRFNEQKQAAEDAEFTMAVCKPDANVKVITEFVYFYRTATPNSLTKRYLTGDLETKRIVYHYDIITADRIDLLEEIRRENEKHEIYVLTNHNELPELSQYAKVMKPCKVRGMELRGEPWHQFTRILPPPVFDIVIYTSQKEVNGIFTWIYSFCSQMSAYDIAVIHEGMRPDMIARLASVTYLKQNGDPVKCHTLMMMKIRDYIPVNIHYDESIQILHSTRLSDLWELPTDRDRIIPVSEAVKESWGLSEKPIHNMTCRDVNVLHLVSATRLSTKEKGLDRMKILCAMMLKAGINFEWDCYSDIDPGIKGITHKGLTTDIRQKIKAADYLVQLSDEEGFCYSIIEALEEGTPIITTPISVLSELGIKDKEHGHIIPFDMKFDVQDLLEIPKVNYTHNNEQIVKEWGKILGKGNGDKPVSIQCTKGYKDMLLQRCVTEGEIITLNHHRADEVINSGFARRI